MAKKRKKNIFNNFNIKNKLGDAFFSFLNKLTFFLKSIIKIKEEIKIISVFFCLFFSIFLSLSFISYLFTWKADQSKLIDIFSADILVENWGGKIGAYFSNLFMYELFGIASFSMIFLLILFGLFLFDKEFEIFKIKKTLISTTILTSWISIALAFIFDSRCEECHFLYGSFGYYFNQTFLAFLGKIGTAFFLFITLFSFIILTIENSLDWIKKQFKNYITISNILLLKKKIFVIFEQIFKKLQNNHHKKIKVIPVKSQKNIIKKNIEKAVEKDEIIYTNITEEPQLTSQIPLEKEIKFKNNENYKNNESNEIVYKNKIVEPENQYIDDDGYVLPSMDFLQQYDNENSEIDNEELEKNKARIKETLENYKIEIIGEAKDIKATKGPTVTLYEIKPAAGVRISKIKNLEDDIALSLSAIGIRIIAPIPGKGTVGIEVPNSEAKIVSIHSLISSDEFQNSKFDLPIAMGKTIDNETYVFDLTKMPHLLMAGATGQGKSVGLNVIITSLLYKKLPSELKFVLIDPKKVELTLYEKIEKFYLAKLPSKQEAIITDNKQVVNTLKSLNIEMDRRYDLLKDKQVRNIKEYNDKYKDEKSKCLPYIVLVIDEFADLIMTAGKEVELPIARLAQLARAIGIHLIIATQRPSANIITGVIKANFPARLAFKVPSMIDSRTILDASGANQLIGRGDMLMTKGSELIRLQCAFIDLPELEKITNSIGEQNIKKQTHLLPDYEELEEE